MWTFYFFYYEFNFELIKKFMDQEIIYCKVRKNIVYNVNNLFLIVRIYFELVIFWNFEHFFLFYKFCCELVNIFYGPIYCTVREQLFCTKKIILNCKNIFCIFLRIYF
jgi:hypothetical protein